MIAALFVDGAGCYAGLPDVDVWDLARDARFYRGPHPVIAHPPCERWGRYWHGSPRKPHQYESYRDVRHDRRQRQIANQSGNTASIPGFAALNGEESVMKKAKPASKRGRGRPKITGPRPWQTEGISRRTWYRRRGIKIPRVEPDRLGK
jgi:hypothetical protein